MNGLRLLLIARLAEKGKHVLLVGLHTRLVERIHPKDVCADAAGLFKEIEEGAEIVLVYLLDRYGKLRNTAIDMGKLGPEFGHGVALLDMLACQEVEPVKILRVIGDGHAAVALFHGDDRLH